MSDHEPGRHDTGRHEIDTLDVLDFPGADRLRAAAGIADPTPAAVTASLGPLRAAIANTAALAAVADTPTVSGDNVNADTANDDLVVTLTSRPRPPQRRRRRILISAAAVAAIAAGVAVYPTVSVGGSHPAAQADAAGFLNQVAATAAAKSPSSAAYWMVQQQGQYNGFHGGTYNNSVVTHWIGRSNWVEETDDMVIAGLDRLIVAHGPLDGWQSLSDARGLSVRGAQPPNEESQTRWLLGEQSPPCGLPDCSNSVTWDELKALPTEPKTLRARLMGNETGPAAEVNLFSGIDTLLSSSPASPPLRSAMFTVLAGIPNVELVGNVKDAAGRTGTAVELDVVQSSIRVIIDPATAQVMEERTLLDMRDGVPAATALTTFLASGPAEHAPPVTE
ncbi:CU044_5270 family protein [Streptomyces sp. CA-111067]|uniref:CU044_5270 family protein n=1 Tax=Streptomyces sp. CA-111067 TaxID=3240046 RepID=UPI003D99ED8C